MRPAAVAGECVAETDMILPNLRGLVVGPSLSKPIKKASHLAVSGFLLCRNCGAKTTSYAFFAAALQPVQWPFGLISVSPGKILQPPRAFASLPATQCVQLSHF